MILYAHAVNDTLGKAFKEKVCTKFLLTPTL